MQPFKIEKAEVEKFAQIWNKSGVHIILPQEAIEFATDFANVAINSFIGMCQAQAAEEAAKRINKKPLIIEGVN
jgi:hypothetical protein